MDTSDNYIITQPNKEHKADPVDWLAIADAVAAQEHERQAAYDAGRIPDNQRDYDRDIAEATAARNRRRAELGLSSERQPAPISEPAATVRETAVTYDDTLFPYVNIAAALIKRNLPGVSKAFDIAKRYSRTHDGAEILTSSQFCDLLAEYGTGKRRALTYLKDGEGLTWDYVGRAKHDRRVKLYRIRSYSKVCAALGVEHPGRAGKLPVDAYTGNSAQYTELVYGAWLVVHDRASRERQSEVFGRTVRHLRRMQARAQVKQQTIGAQAYQPRNHREGEELGAVLANDEGEMKHHWYGPNGILRWQESNLYLSGRAGDMGLKRAGFIKAQAERLRESPVDQKGKANLEVGGATSPAFHEPKRFHDQKPSTAAKRAGDYQGKHKDRTALWLFGTMPDARPVPSHIIQAPTLAGYQFEYSLYARLGAS